MNMSDIISQKETYLQSAFIAVAACGIMKVLFTQIFPHETNKSKT